MSLVHIGFHIDVHYYLWKCEYKPKVEVVFFVEYKLSNIVLIP